jgi:hypothetical protein
MSSPHQTEQFNTNFGSFAAIIGANKKFLFLITDFDDFLSHISINSQSIRKIKFEIKIDFSFKFKKLKGHNIYNLKIMGTKINISPKLFKATHSLIFFTLVLGFQSHPPPTN